MKFGKHRGDAVVVRLTLWSHVGVCRSGASAAVPGGGEARRSVTRSQRRAATGKVTVGLAAVRLDGHSVKTSVYRVTDNSDVYRTLRQIDERQRDSKTFIVDLTTRQTELLLRKIVRLRGRRFENKRCRFLHAHFSIIHRSIFNFA